ncbi:unnamed protein product [Ilex paraguariensis]|uniref:Secreted protein n=1 Tax=Ilex paraguariensis TaxID=185542 RepID=A0ABC8U6C2_9AQUA
MLYRHGCWLALVGSAGADFATANGLRCLFELDEWVSCPVFVYQCILVNNSVEVREASEHGLRSGTLRTRSLANISLIKSFLSLTLWSFVRNLDLVNVGNNEGHLRLYYYRFPR